jgi:hypothetical protein
MRFFVNVKGEKKEPRKWVWITRDGREIHVSKMDDNHLRNTIRFLRRWAQRLADQMNELENRWVWDADDAASSFWWDAETFLNGVATWPTLLWELERRDLKELPVEEMEKRVDG